MLFYVFFICFLIQVDFAVLALLRGGGKRTADNVPGEGGVSVIICARNEAANLRENLPRILDQQYPEFEVIVVNDGSTDDSASVLASLKLRFAILKVIDTPGGGKGKKRLLKAAADIASFDKLLLTDADCKPASPRWLTLMTAPITEGKEIVAGYGGYHRVPGLLNAFTRWETLHTWLQLTVLARGGAPYMAVGRNLACTSRALRQAMSHPLWHALPSGDDDLLVRIVATQDNYVVQDNPASFTWSAAKTRWRDWYTQKQRHMSTGKYYRLHVKLLLGAYALSHAAGWLAFFLLLFTPAAATVCWLWGARCVLQWIAMARAARVVREERLVPFLPLFDIGWMMYNFALLPYITWKNKTTWK